ncbi:MAG: gliding motility lipoprotein GldH [Flavobacteriaceae bacterium]|nr:gliding motility lipoprotein GldH [Flavobacteriaceae bacterium]|tara:strand:- start:206223 stop:206714 length:492 start_codon:yes stop_codon:yes gene_type:complete
MTKSSKLFLLSVFLLVLFESCDSSIEFIDFKSVSNTTWTTEDTISFTFPIKDTITPKNLFLHIRNNNDYEFNNLFVVTKLKFPNNQVIIDTLQYEMADKNGKLLGDGLSSIKESKLFYKENKVFPVSGDYTVSVYQAMRKQGEIASTNLNGVSEIGFSIEKRN